MFNVYVNGCMDKFESNCFPHTPTNFIALTNTKIYNTNKIQNKTKTNEIQNRQKQNKTKTKQKQNKLNKNTEQEFNITK